ncbi:hypothetical protein MAFF212519_05660 [Clavibacter michiganensis]
MSIAVPVRPRHPGRAIAAAGVTVVVVAACWSADIAWDRLADLPAEVVRYLWLMFSAPDWSKLPEALAQTWISVLMAWVGTVIGIVISVPLAFVAARGFAPAAVRWPLRILFSAIRAVPEIITAIIILSVTGLTPLTGALALAVSSVGTLGKWGYESVEGVDGGPLEAVRAAGGGAWSLVRWGVWPQASGEFLSFWLYRFEINVRASAVLGLIGSAGSATCSPHTLSTGSGPPSACSSSWSSPSPCRSTRSPVPSAAGSPREPGSVQWSDDVGPTTRIATVVNALQPSERRVVQLILDDTEGVVEITAQELADRAGVARSTVVRSCQSLGYRGYPQLRVALTRELARSSARASTAAGDDAHGPSALGRIRSDLDALAVALPRVASVLTEAEVEDAVTRVVGARRLVIVASGLSSPLALDLSMRLTAVGRPAEHVADPIGQQIAVSRLGADDAVLVISGSGANELSLRAARSARASGAGIVVVTSFATSPIGALADVALVVAPAKAGFRHEVEHTSRIPHMIVLESLVEIVADRLGEDAVDTRAGVLAILSDALSD